MNHIRPEQYSLRSGVQRQELEYGVRYTIPFNRETVRISFDYLSRALWSLKQIADTRDDDDYDSAFIYAEKRLDRIFKEAYDYDFEEKKAWNLPTVEDVFHNLVWYHGIEPQTFVIEKTDKNLILEYKQEFEADDETLSVDKTEIDSVKYSGIKACGDGIKHIHAPYNPSYLEEWRYRPSKVAFSIREDSGTVTFGIKNRSPKVPLWYRLYRPLSVMGGPYSNVTFDMENQTRVVKYVHNRNREPKV